MKISLEISVFKSSSQSMFAGYFCFGKNKIELHFLPPVGNVQVKIVKSP